MDISGKKPTCISFQAGIVPETTNVLMGALSEAVNKKFDEIHLLLSSPGGQVREGITAYNFIQALPVPVHTYNIGSVDSIANVIYQVAKHVFVHRPPALCFTASVLIFKMPEWS